MKFYCKLTAVFTLLLAVFAAPAADKLAVAEPVNKGGISASDIEAFWGILESSINSDEYTLISRGALKQMLTEIGLTENSDLVNLNSAQRARMGEVEGVKYILVSEVGKFGTRINCTMRIVDATTGEIDTARTANLRVRDLDELADKIEATLDKLLSDDKELMMSAILMPNLQIAKIPDYLAETFNIRLESGLLAGGVRLQNLRSVAKILRDNNLDGLYEMEPKMFRKVGGLLEVQYLIQATMHIISITAISPVRFGNRSQRLQLHRLSGGFCTGGFGAGRQRDREFPLHRHGHVSISSRSGNGHRHEQGLRQDAHRLGHRLQDPSRAAPDPGTPRPLTLMTEC